MFRITYPPDWARTSDPAKTAEKFHPNLNQVAMMAGLVATVLCMFVPFVFLFQTHTRTRTQMASVLHTIGKLPFVRAYFAESLSVICYFVWMCIFSARSPSRSLSLSLSLGRSWIWLLRYPFNYLVGRWHHYHYHHHHHYWKIYGAYIARFLETTHTNILEFWAFHVGWCTACGFKWW